MNRNLFLIVCVFLSIIGVMLTGNVVIIGDKIGQVTHVYVEYAFYAIILVLAFIYLIRPIIRTHRAPEFPTLSVGDDWNSQQMLSLAKRLASNCDYIKDVEKRKKHKKEFMEKVSFHCAEPENLKILISNEVALRMDGNEDLDVLGVDARIKEWGKTVFIVTAISQNSIFDTISVLVMNYRMISDVILASGFKPTKPQLFKIYVRILTTALVTYCTSQVFTDVDGVAPFDISDAADMTDAGGIDVGDVDVDDVGGFGDSILNNLKKLEIPGVVVGSTVQGCMNALLTMRIGYVTKAYLLEGPAAMNGVANKRRVKRQAMKASFKAMPSVVMAGGASIGKSTVGVLSKIFSE